VTVEAYSRPLVPQRLVRLSILGLWGVYFLVNTLRMWVFDKPDQLDMLGRRLFVTVIGIGLTWLIYLMMRRMRDTRFAARAAAALALCVPLAVSYATVNWLAFYKIAPSLETLKEMASLPPRLTQPHLMILDSTISWFPLFGAWAALYLALVYAAEVRAADEHAASYRAAAQAAELRALRYQVNPHFLFNTLNSLSTLIMTGRNASAEQMLMNLSTFFRSSLTCDPNADVELVEEMRLQRLYLDIEQVRFPDRLVVRRDIAAGLDRALVPALILQPLVENAIKYGVSRSRRPVTVTLRARARDGELVLSVEDDALCDPALAELSPGQQTSTGTGLRNVRERLETRFGRNARALWGPLQPCGFAAVLTMPLTRACEASEADWLPRDAA